MFLDALQVNDVDRTQLRVVGCDVLENVTKESGKILVER
jgi:hypothetical protein